MKLVMSPATHMKAVVLSQDAGISVSEWIEQACLEKIAREEKHRFDAKHPFGFDIKHPEGHEPID